MITILEVLVNHIKESIDIDIEVNEKMIKIEWAKSFKSTPIRKKRWTNTKFGYWKNFRS